jgi:hypothetical protein
VDINKIKYRLLFSSGDEKSFELHLRADNLSPIGWVPNKPPEWTALEFHKCSNCPLNVQQSPYCPASLNLAKLVDECQGMDLLEPIMLEVKTADRMVTVSSTVQKAIGSFVGLLMATSDCPHAAFFRPLARFHLPLASEGETIYRSVAAFLYAQYYLNQSGQQADFDMDGLFDIYRNLETVNTALASRIRAAGENDDLAKTIMEWDVFSGMFPLRTGELMEQMKPFFASYLKKQ